MIPVPQGRRQQLLRQSEPLKQSRGARLGAETLTYVPATATIRPLRDQLLIQPLGVVYSRRLYVHRDTKPLRGIVRAAGPGSYEVGYRDAQGKRTNDRTGPRRRTQRFHTNRYVPMSVKIGDVVELGGSEHEGYGFEGLFWGSVYHIWCTERDVCGIVTDGEARREAISCG